MNMLDFLAGIAILRPHYVEPDGYNLGAEHDVIYAYSTDTPLSDEEVKKMRGLGWLQEDVERDEEENALYDSEEGWAAYVRRTNYMVPDCSSCGKPSPLGDPCESCKAAMPKVLACTRPAPHVCRVNGPCNGWPTSGVLDPEDNYVAWCRRTEGGTIVTCDSDAPKAFKVYRYPSKEKP